MIHSENSIVLIKGSKIELEKDLALIMKTLLDKHLMTVQSINICLELAQMTEQEMLDETEKALKEIFEKLNKKDDDDNDTFNNVFGDLL